MSNYPPGVTGNEYEIAGADSEWCDNDFECNNQEFKYVRITPYALKKIEELVNGYYKTQHLDSIKENLYKKLSVLHAAIATGPDTEIITGPCGYVGSVDKQSYREDIWWECPRCRKSYEEKIELYYGDDDY